MCQACGLIGSSSTLQGCFCEENKGLLRDSSRTRAGCQNAMLGPAGAALSAVPSGHNTEQASRGAGSSHGSRAAKKAHQMPACRLLHLLHHKPTFMRRVLSEDYRASHHTEQSPLASEMGKGRRRERDGPRRAAQERDCATQTVSRHRLPTSLLCVTELVAKSWLQNF